MKLENFIASARNILEEKTILIFWNVLLFSGGVIFLFYFLHIEYVPELSLNSVILLFASGAIIAGTIILFLCLLLAIPGVIWDETAWSIGYFFKEEKDILVNRKIFYWYGLPSIFSIICLHLYYFEDINYFIVFLALGSIFYTIALFVAKSSKIAISLLASWLSGAVFFVLPLLFVYGMANDMHFKNNFNDWTKVIFSIVIIIFTNIIILLKPDKHNKISWIIIVTIFSITYITMILGSWSFIPKIIFTKTKLGNIENAKIVMTNDGCQIFEVYGLKVDYSKNGELCVNHDSVKILSRIGNTLYIETSGDGDKKTNFTLPQSSVKSWSTFKNTTKVEEKNT